MKTPAPSRVLLAALLATALPARASFHLYDIQEVFTNADGSVQFIELFTTSGFQQFLTGHSITFQLNGSNQTPLVLSDLPGDTTNKTFLVGTANLATLYGVTPDFVIPANFLAQGSNNFINFAEGTDRVNLSLLPVNGASSLNGLINDGGQTSASTSINLLATPTNFAGATAVIPEPGGTLLYALGIGLAAMRHRRISP